MTNDWVPVWLGIIASLAFVAVLIVHLWHVVTGSGRWRAWHGGHVLMALGMLGMYLPWSGAWIPVWLGETVFALAAVAALGGLIADRTVGGRGFGLLWLVTAVDLAAMAYMYGMDSWTFAPLTVLLVVWLVAQAVAWSIRRLGTDGLGEPATRGHDLAVRTSLVVMNLGMAYMFLAMQYGMPPMPAMPGMPGMPDMPGM